MKIITITNFSREIDLQFLLLFQITDPLEKALASKNKGNKYFKGGRYELAIKCYTEAIEVCPESKKTDLSTFYQNRAAAYEQLVSTVHYRVSKMNWLYSKVLLWQQHLCTQSILNTL